MASFSGVVPMPNMFGYCKCFWFCFLSLICHWRACMRDRQFDAQIHGCSKHTRFEEERNRKARVSVPLRLLWHLLTFAPDKIRKASSVIHLSLWTKNILFVTMLKVRSWKSLLQFLRHLKSINITTMTCRSESWRCDEVGSCQHKLIVWLALQKREHCFEALVLDAS